MATKQQTKTHFSLYATYDAAGRGTRLKLTLPNGKGISLQGSDIRYLGLKVGNIYSVNLSGDKHEVMLEAVIDPQVSDMIGDDTEFWLLKPGISFQGVENLETLISGYRIQLKPATAPSFKRHFVVATEPPLPHGTLKVKLLAKQLDSIQVGDPILYRGLRIGEVHTIGVTPDNSHVQLTLIISPEYNKLVTGNSRFFITPAMRMQASLDQGIEVASSPIEALVRGGISIINLEGKNQNHPPKQSYLLFADERDAISGIQPAPLLLALITDELRGIQKGAPVYFREFRVGKVDSIEMNDQQQFEVGIAIADKHRQLVNSSSLFWNVSGINIEAGLNGIKVESDSLLALAMGGIAFDTPDMQASLTPLPSSLYMDEQQAKKPATTIELQVPIDAQIAIGTEIRYAGYVIGEVKHIALQSDLRQIKATAEIANQYARPFTQTGSSYWIEQAKVAITGIKNPEALLSGDFISALPGSGDTQTSFTAPIGKPLTMAASEGLILFLQSDRLHAHNPGTPILHRQVKVGEILHAELEETGRSVLLQAKIYPRYAHLIRNNTYFWNASGVELKAGLFSGVEVNTESMSAILSGGIAFSTPDNQPIQPKARTGSRMRLYDKAEPEWRNWRASITKD